MAEIRRKKVFIVDDDFIHVASLKRWVVNAGFDVETSFNGKDALEKIAEYVPDLFVVDSIMPGMNGFELCRRIRADERTKGVPIIMVTGMKSESDTVEARMSGANEVLIKPVSEKDLVERIRSFLHTPFV